VGSPKRGHDFRQHLVAASTLESSSIGIEHMHGAIIGSCTGILCRDGAQSGFECGMGFSLYVQADLDTNPGFMKDGIVVSLRAYSYAGHTQRCVTKLLALKFLALHGHTLSVVLV